MRERQEKRYISSVLDKKNESIERIENRRLERQLVNIYLFILLIASA